MKTNLAIKKQRETALVNEYGTLVKRIAYHVSSKMPGHVQTDDLIQAGLMGLLEAADRFSADKGACFTTYAGIRIRGAMLDEVRRTDWVPRSVYRDNRKVQEAMRKVESVKGSDAKATEVAHELKIEVGAYHKMLQNSHAASVYSIDELGLNEERLEGEFNAVALEPYKILYEEKFQNSLFENIGKLPEKERKVIELYYLEECNLREIGKILGVTESRVCQIHAQAVARLKGKMQEW
ncbi:MAG: RNA polymerase sigma factor FliA [Gammaproteobacteria bacterium]|jgi:RNA polymerase sigma factor for flagellar operon FliA